ncbi:MAG: prepilin-type N-terminal cleavage/methylation domain-containing protein [Calothrix sp. MO_192.B10]|nr:prepilin-type N-terminal cleavage/methylation domain-containing protein [Calothrix sp. MO_192.B10]
MNQYTWKLLSPANQRDSQKRLSDSKDNGFTLLEVLAAVFMVGILAAIAAPGWLGFVKRQRLNKAGDLVLAALQEAQREAKKNKRDYSVSFKTNSGIPQISVYSGDTPNNWRDLGEDVGIQPGQVLLGTNLSNSNTNTASTSNSVDFNNLTTEKTITFDHMGTLPNANFGTPPSGSTETPGLRIVVAIPQSTNSTTPSNDRRCVIIETLIGGMRTAKDDDCEIN